MPDRRDVDQLLDDMDDVITDWDGSRDAMRWRPTPEKPDQLPDMEGMRSAVAVLGEAFQRHLPALREVFRSLAEWAASPATQDLITAAQAEQVEAEQGCHCLCGKNHPGDARCLGIVPAAEVVVVRFGAESVPMCGPCAGEESDDA